MKFIKRALLTILILTMLGMLFRGGIYRQLVSYESVGIRNSYAITNDKLKDPIDGSIDKNLNPDIEQIIKISLSITSNQLTFTAANNDIDPNLLIDSKTAHCVGYAVFFSSTCNYLLKKYDMEDTWLVEHQIGQLYILGTNVHQYTNSSFFKDHDFVTIENIKTGAKYAVDPSLHDYAFIDFVVYKE